jgi:hypothetical protein
VFLRIPTLVAGADREAAWNRVQSVLEGYAADAHNETVVGEGWRMLYTFATHYLRLLEIRSHEANVARLAALAWWMADRVTHVLVETAIRECGQEKAGKYLRRFVQEGFMPSLMRSAAGFRLARPLRPPSTVGYFTTGVTALWKCSLLEVQPGESLVVPPEVVESMHWCFVWGFAMGLPSLSRREQDPLWAIESPWLENATKWQTHFAVPEQETDAAAPAQESEKENIPETLPEMLRAILQFDEEAQGYVLDRVRFSTGIGTLTPDSVPWLIDDGAWFDNVFTSLSIQEFDSLMDCLLDLLRIGNEEWRVRLPHILRRQALRRDLANDRRYHAATMTLHACVVAGRVGAIVGLMDALDSVELRDKVSSWWGRLNEIRQVSPASVQGRLRDILAHLPGAEPAAERAQAAS